MPGGITVVQTSITCYSGTAVQACIPGYRPLFNIGAINAASRPGICCMALSVAKYLWLNIIRKFR